MIRKIDKYILEEFCGGREKYPLKSQIWLSNNEHQVFAAIRFYKNPADMPDKDYPSQSGKLIKAHCLPEQYPEIVDILRNESPVYFWYDEKNQKSLIRTSSEPIGEGDEGL